MSNRASGQRFELRCKKYLESLGFKVDKARAAIHFIGPGKFFSSANDFLGCADLLAVHAEKPYTLFVQCTLDPRSRRLDKLKAVPWNLSVHRVQLWSPSLKVRGEIRVQQLTESGWSDTSFRLRNALPCDVL